MITAEIFFEELKRLVSSRPKFPTQVLYSEDVEWGQNDYYCKNLYWAFDNMKCTEGAYLSDCVSVVKSYDLDYCAESELSYESVDAVKCYDSVALENCINTRNSFYSVKCSNCTEVFGCVGLKNKNFCIFNRQLTESDYRAKVALYKKWPAEKVWETVRALQNRYPVTQTNEFFNENSSFGNYVYYSKNCYMCFDITECENSGYIFNGQGLKSCYDVTYSSPSELAYEITDSGSVFNSHHIVWSANIVDCAYILDAANLKNCFGCTGFTNKQYVLLNRQLTKDDYQRISKQIMEDINRKNLGWGPLEYARD